MGSTDIWDKLRDWFVVQQLPDISWLDLKEEEDFNTFKVECRKVYEIVAPENEPYAKVLYSREWFWTKRW